MFSEVGRVRRGPGYPEGCPAPNQRSAMEDKEGQMEDKEGQIDEIDEMGVFLCPTNER
jgi:hypothetical protein